MSEPHEASFGRLVFNQCVLDDGEAARAYDTYLREVFAFAPERRRGADPGWLPFSYFEPEGKCVAGVEAAVLRLVAHGRETTACAIRLAGVADSHRGRGLFRDLMRRALDWCAAQSAGPVLLYTETPTLYTRFGFRPLAQHAFAGPAPAAAPVQAAAIVDRPRASNLVDRLAAGRAPVSNACAIVGASDLLRTALEDDAGLVIAYAPELEALIVHEIDDRTLVLVDVVASAMPTMPQIVGALRTTCSRVRTLFPPDRLDWHGTPAPDDTGLMVRGRVPAAMERPFMLPPTTGF